MNVNKLVPIRASESEARPSVPKMTIIQFEGER
jgi:hypothetical protein